MNDQATFCATAVDEWVRAGVRHAVVSPGSRSTPLVLALAARSEIALHVVLDERAAAFTALGIGKASSVPAVLVSTSGTAAVNHHPAVVEAGLAGVPLLVCTADRPPDLHDVGAPQTIEQRGLFGDAPRWNADVDPAAFAPDSWRSVAARAMAACAHGPVHLNLRFREPLLGDAGPLPEGRPDGAPWHTVDRAERVWEPDDDVLAPLDGRRLLVVAGEGADDGSRLWLDRAPWPVLADPLSGLRAPLDGVVTAFDSIARVAAQLPGLAPEVVLHLGAPPASKALEQWLDSLDADHVVVANGSRWLDPSRRAARRVEATPGSVCAALVALTRPPAELRETWARAQRAAVSAIDGVLRGQAQVTEPAVAAAVARAVPDASTIVVSSSMPIRDVEWFAGPRRSVRVLANRGANGIDGVTSTALGVALAHPTAPTVCLLGDLALLHDASALHGLASRECSLTLVVVDNHGGGIFSFLPQAGALDRGRFEQLFGTPQATDVSALLSAHGIAPTEVDTPSLLDRVLAVAASRPGVDAVVVRTDRATNVAVHAELQEAVAAAVRAALA